MQAPDPRTALYLPAMQLVHVLPSGPLKPLLHLQSLTASLAGKESEPAGHSVHVLAFVASVTEENVPLEQLLHATKKGPSLYFPGIQAAQVIPSHLFCPVGTDQLATNPERVTTESEVKTTCKYPLDDVHVVLELTELPLSEASDVLVLHDDDVHL